MADNELFNYDVNPPALYQQYSAPVTSTTSVTNLGDTTIITTINGGGGGKATGPAITIGSNWSGINFVASGNNQINLDILNAANARIDLGAAARGVNTDITQLNGASQVDVSGVYKVDGTQVVKEQQPAVANPTGGATIDAEARAQLILLLDAMRAHGLIST